MEYRPPVAMYDHLDATASTASDGMPWKREDVGSEGFFEYSGGLPRFTLCNCWCGDEEPHSFELRGTSKSHVLQCEHDSDHRFNDRELVLSRSDLVFNSRPDIVLTTLESLENFAHKPHYPLIDRFGTIALDGFKSVVRLQPQLRAVTDGHYRWEAPPDRAIYPVPILGQR